MRITESHTSHQASSVRQLGSRMHRNDFLRWFSSGFCVLKLPHQLTPAKDTNSNPSTKTFISYLLSFRLKRISPQPTALISVNRGNLLLRFQREPTSCSNVKARQGWCKIAGKAVSSGKTSLFLQILARNRTASTVSLRKLT